MPGQPAHHPPLVAAEIGHLQKEFVGENHLVSAGEALPHPPLDLEQAGVVLLEDGLRPGGGDAVNLRAQGIVGAHLGHVGLGDRVGLENVDVLPMVGLKADLREGPGQLRQVRRGLGAEEGLVNHPALLKIVERRAVGQHRRGVHGHQMGVWGEGAVGPAGGYRETAPLPGEIADGFQVALRYPQVQAVQRVVKVAGQQQAVKFPHGASFRPSGGLISDPRPDNISSSDGSSAPPRYWL